MKLGGMEVSMKVVSVEPGCRIDVMEADLDWMMLMDARPCAVSTAMEYPSCT